VLLTGSTCSIGSHLLEALVQDPSVTKVYALNRKDASGARSVYIRQATSFRERALDFGALNSEKLELLEGDLEAENFGLDDDSMYEEIRKSVTCVVCCCEFPPLIFLALVNIILMSLP
jgi:thioester reductase-like protein